MVQGVVLDGGGQFAQRVRVLVVAVEDLVAALCAGRGTVLHRVLLFIGDPPCVEIDGLVADHGRVSLRS